MGVFRTAVEAHAINSFCFIGQVEITLFGQKGWESALRMCNSSTQPGLLLPLSLPA